MKWQKAFLREENTKYFLTDFQTEKFFCRKPGRKIVMSDFRTEYSTKFRKSENISVCFPEKQTISSGYSAKSIAKHIKYERTDSFLLSESIGMEIALLNTEPKVIIIKGGYYGSWNIRSLY